MIDNKKIPTWLGVVIIIIFAITVGVMVWRYEKNHEITKINNNVITSKETIVDNKKEESQTKQLENEVSTPIDTSDWKICKSNQYNYQISYPQDWIITQAPVQKITTNCENVFSFGIIAEKNLYTQTRATINFNIEIDNQTRINAPTSTDKGMKSLDDFIKLRPKLYETNTFVKEITIRGERALWVKNTEESYTRSAGTALYIFHQGSLYRIGSNADDNTFNAFISTFKFIR
jgi:hypothetical protein